MALEVRGDAEGPVAFLAFVRLFSGVSSQVSRQVGRARKMLPAILARISMTPDAAIGAGAGATAAANDHAAGSAKERHCGGGGCGCDVNGPGCSHTVLRLRLYVIGVRMIKRGGSRLVLRIARVMRNG